MANPETYLGDGVYATHDGYHVWLDCRAQPGLTIGPSGAPSIALEPPVLRELMRFVERCQAEATA
jgi:hypothetical protein